MNAVPSSLGTAHAVAAPPRTVAPPTLIRVALLGNPNTGKSTLFNALTGMRQRVGNFPGVTVERVEGSYRAPGGRRVEVIDLPGSYSLSPRTPDEAIAMDVLLGLAKDVPAPDVIVVVVDALHLERNLFLTSQLLEVGRPLVMALNQMDAAEAAGIRIDAVELIHELGVTVIPTVATRAEGIDRLKHAIEKAADLPAPTRRFTIPDDVTRALAPVEEAFVREGFPPRVAALEALLHVATPQSEHGADVEATLERARAALRGAGVKPESVEAELRYGWITSVVEKTVTHVTPRGRTKSDRVDAVLLHRVWGPLIFLAIMAIMFQGIFTWAGPIQDGIEQLLGWLGGRVGSYMPAGDLRSLMVDGVIAGAGSVLVFLPQIAILFLFIGVLEDSGYMARAAFIMDRYMRRVGLHGRSFIPLLSGYACAVPAIMSTRTIEHTKDRFATIMVVPLMSCSARLPVYTLLIGAFIPPLAIGGVFDLQGVTMLAMYLLGTVFALLVASMFKRTLLRGPVQPLIIELPPYRVPHPRALLMAVGHRAMLFVRRAGTIILAVSVLLWALATYPKLESAGASREGGATRTFSALEGSRTPEELQEAQLSHSFLGRVGHAIEPMVRPLGYDWKIGVSMVASFAAREVFVSTMGTIYGVGAVEGTDAALSERLKAERNPRTGRPVYTPLVAIGLMVFYVFALMCVSTVAVTVRETGGGWRGAGWAALQFGYMFVLAYGAGWIVYRVGSMLGWGGGGA
jgi:ferrous iron transport protein B